MRRNVPQMTRSGSLSDERRRRWIVPGAMIIAVVVVECFIFNPGFVSSRLLRLPERRYSIADGFLYKFGLRNGELVAENNDPSITFNDVNLPVETISIQCKNTAYGATGQVFYRGRDEVFGELHSVRYDPALSDITLTLSQTPGFPEAVPVASLRFDLTDTPGDVVSCRDFVINPPVPFRWNVLRLAAYAGLLLLGILFVRRGLKPATYLWSSMVQMRSIEVIQDRFFLGLCAVLALIDLLYPVTFTYDSGQYFSYFRILSGELPWSNWDATRGIVFPLYLKVVTDLFGNTMNALLIPAIVCHIFLFVAASHLLLDGLKEAFSWSKKRQRLLLLIVFAFVAMDPLILGYFHAALTEYVESSIALLSCLLAYVFYKRSSRGPRTKLIFFTTFSLLVIIAWHLKQPSVGAAWLPLFLVSIVLMVHQKNRTFSYHMLLGNVFVIATLLVSILAWDKAIARSGVASSPQRRTTSYWLERYYNQSFDLVTHAPGAFSANVVTYYLSSSNVYGNDFANSRIDRRFYLTRAVQNGYIGYHIFFYGLSNMQLPSVYPKSYMENIAYYSSRSYPPMVLNDFLKNSSIRSTVLFSTLYLLVPFYFLFLSLLLITAGLGKNHLMISYLCCGTAFLNALEHAVFARLLDRYLFLGYPLLLISLGMLLVYLPRLQFARKRSAEQELLS
jgi:hypothetical protein